MIPFPGGKYQVEPLKEIRIFKQILPGVTLSQFKQVRDEDLCGPCFSV